VNARSKALVLVAALVAATTSVVGRGFQPRLTFNRDIAPILWTRCATCHHPDGPAPFSLVAFADAKAHARQIAEVTRRRYMPPWKPDAASGPFVGDRRLTDREIDLLARWVEGGATEGSAPDRRTPPQFHGGWQLGVPDAIVTLPEYTLRADGIDVFRNFVVSFAVDPPAVASSPPTASGPPTVASGFSRMSAARYVRGLEFVPGSRAVHHANIRIDRTPASRELDEADPQPGYEGVILKSADYPDGHFLGWTPGQTAPLAPVGRGWRLTSGTDFVIQLHLRPTGRVERVQPRIGLYFANDPPTRTPVMLRLGRQNLDIPAGAASYVVTDSYVLPTDVEVEAIQPHAHYRAREVRARADAPDGATRSLISIANWDFNWQDQYRFVSPAKLTAGTRITTEYVFDNSDANPRNPLHPPARVAWGWRSSDEMADVWLQVTTSSDADRERLAADIRRKMAAEDAVGCETLIAREPDHVNLRNDAAVLYLELGQPDRALTHFEAVRRLHPDSAVAHYNVGIALEALGRTADAAREYESALRYDPRYSAAHNNLGNTLLATGRLAEARNEYQRAVDAGPANAEAHNNLGGVLVALGEIEEAVRLLQRALQLRPVYAEAHFNLARAFAASGRRNDAIDAANVASEEAAAEGKTQLREQIRALIRSFSR
jgi:tetratricopeptide (TPR) repeat protein/mono/diheme cytochrome c family protein